VRVAQFLRYFPQHPFRFFKHLGIPEPHDLIAIRGEPLTSRRIGNCMLCMLGAIDFDDETSLLAKKICHEHARAR
jgi:hypothetical protein